MEEVKSFSGDEGFLKNVSFSSYVFIDNPLKLCYLHPFQSFLFNASKRLLLIKDN